jgi:hypothetical protein
MQNIVDSQISDVDQSIVNYGDMIDVIQDANVYQSMTPTPASVPAETQDVSALPPPPPPHEHTNPITHIPEILPAEQPAVLPI